MPQQPPPRQLEPVSSNSALVVVAVASWPPRSPAALFLGRSWLERIHVATADIAASRDPSSVSLRATNRSQSSEGGSESKKSERYVLDFTNPYISPFNSIPMLNQKCKSSTIPLLVEQKSPFPFLCLHTYTRRVLAVPSVARSPPGQ